MESTVRDSLAERLQGAWEHRKPIAPLSERGELTHPADAYAVQQAWAALRVSLGERIVGRKIGLTSPGMRRQMGVNEPDYGDLWGSREFRAVGGIADISLSPFIQPRVEGELAFLLGSDLDSDTVGESDVRDAAKAVAPAIEIVDSRIHDWRITLVDTIADNASYGGFVLGAWSEDLLELDLAALRMEIRHNGIVSIQETGAAVLGSPFSAVAWLARTLNGHGVPLRRGEIVLSGSFGGAIPAGSGDRFDLILPHHALSLTARFE